MVSRNLPPHTVTCMNKSKDLAKQKRVFPGINNEDRRLHIFAYVSVFVSRRLSVLGSFRSGCFGPVVIFFCAYAEPRPPIFTHDAHEGIGFFPFAPAKATVTMRANAVQTLVDGRRPPSSEIGSTVLVGYALVEGAQRFAASLRSTSTQLQHAGCAEGS